ncbi:Cna B-type domain-containing protein [Bacillus sanguinis]
MEIRICRFSGIRRRRKAYKYEVKEQPVEGYQTEVNGYNITNTKVGETKVEGTKTWKDNNSPDRPSVVKVDLLQNGKVIDTKEVTAKTNWMYTFERLQVYDADGVAYIYTVKEQPVDGYQTEVNGYDITNTKVGETKVEGAKTWKDNNSPDRPEKIKVDLLQNGKSHRNARSKRSNKLEIRIYRFISIRWREEKHTSMKCKEQPVAGYQTEVNGYDITNTKVGQTKVEGTKNVEG